MLKKVEAVLYIVVISLLSNCGDAEHYYDTSPELGPIGGARSYPVGYPCTAGATFDCTIMLPSHGSQLECAIGKQYCQQGRWSQCLGK
jgi:hypothetical protein